MLGSLSYVFETTIEYLKTRIQFDVPIGTFQALQHRAAEMFGDVELARSVVVAAANAIDEGATDVPQLASLAKAKLNDTFHHVSNEGIQMHGGIGMTDEFDMGFFLKRSRVATETFGNSAFHRDRYRQLCRLLKSLVQSAELVSRVRGSVNAFPRRCSRHRINARSASAHFRRPTRFARWTSMLIP